MSPPTAPAPRLAYAAALAAAAAATLAQLGMVYVTLARFDPLLLQEMGTTPLRMSILMAGPCAALGLASGLAFLPARRLPWYWAVPAGIAVSFLLAWLLSAAGLRIAATV